MPATPPNRPSIATEWDLGALVDLEYFADSGEDGEQTGADAASDPRERDRAFFLDLEKSDAATAADRGRVLRSWVAMMRRTVPGATPGMAVAEVAGVMRGWGGLAGFMLGALFAWGALNITGRQVNVTLFWLLVVGLPLMVTLLAFLPLLFRRAGGSPGVLRGWLAGWLAAAAEKTAITLDRKTPQASLARGKRLRGTLKRQLAGRGQIAGGALVCLLHGYGLAVALGIVASIALFRTVAHQDYGWSTHWLEDRQMHTLVRSVAWPWSGITGDGAGHPTLEQVRGTRVFRDRGPLDAPDGASAAWSSFLLWSALCYGVLPRVALMAAGRWRWRAALRAFDFERYDELWRRMTTPAFGIDVPRDGVAPAVHPALATSRATPGAGMLWTPANLGDAETLARVERALRERQFDVLGVEPLPDRPSQRRERVEACAGRDLPRLMLLQSASMVPNQSFMRMLRQLREAIGPRVPLHVVVLVDADTPGDTDPSVEAWRDRLDAIGDPWLGLVTLDAGESGEPTIPEQTAATPPP